jgi:hypothetical protein
MLAEPQTLALAFTRGERILKQEVFSRFVIQRGKKHE